MAKDTGFAVDFSDFEKKFKKIVEKEIPGTSAEAMYQAGAMLIRDAITEQPYAPHDKGGLWRSQKVEQPKVGWQEIGVEVGFDIEYAHKVHEAPSNWNWKLKGSGPQFLSSKLIRNREKYMKHVADAIKNKAK